MAIDLNSEQDIERLIGEPETMELEFKGPEDFNSWPQTKDKIAEDLSKQVSAFANSYGGQIVIGVKEARGSHQAETIIGVDPSRPSIQNLQRLVEGNVRPRPEGVRYRSIHLSGVNAGRVVYVIRVPQGKTAYQARDKLYYGRSEYECVPLEDQLIRYKMIRDRLAEATIRIDGMAVETAEQEFAMRKRKLKGLRERQATGTEIFIIRPEQREALEAPPRTFDRYMFQVTLRNVGTITIRDCALDIEMSGLPAGALVNSGGQETGKHKWLFRIAAANRTNIISRSGRQTSQTVDFKLFPSQELPIPGAVFRADLPARSEVTDIKFLWTLYLEDSQHVSGSIDIGDLLKAAAEHPQDDH